MLQEVVVRPWRDTAELLEVRSLLFAPDAAGYDREETARRKRLGVSIVHTWKRRSHIPHSIYATALLVDATTTHNDLLRARRKAEQNSSLPSGPGKMPRSPSPQPLYNPLTARSLYATAIARFVTGFCDTAQTSSGPKRNMYDVAAGLDMPLQWVEMRHEITHGEMPNVDDMQEVAQNAVAWLWQGYWSRLAQAKKPEPKDEGKREADMRAALKALLKARKSSIRAGKNIANTEEVSQVVAAAKGDKGLNTVARILVADKLLLPSLKSSDLNMKAAFLIWDAPLHALIKNTPLFYRNLVTTFQYALIADPRSTPQSDLAHDATFQWLSHILLSPSWLASRLLPSRAHDIPSSVMEFCLVNPTFWTAKLRRTLLENSDQSFQSNWAGLDSASLKLEYGAELIDNSGATIDDLMRSVELDAHAARAKRAHAVDPSGSTATPRGDTVPSLRLDGRGSGSESDDDEGGGGKNKGGWKLWEGPWTPRPIGV